MYDCLKTVLQCVGVATHIDCEYRTTAVPGVPAASLFWSPLKTTVPADQMVTVCFVFASSSNRGLLWKQHNHTTPHLSRAQVTRILWPSRSVVFGHPRELYIRLGDMTGFECCGLGVKDRNQHNHIHVSRAPYLRATDSGQFRLRAVGVATSSGHQSLSPG
jgi:hypothetical protein